MASMLFFLSFFFIANEGVLTHSVRSSLVKPVAFKTLDAMFHQLGVS